MSAFAPLLLVLAFAQAADANPHVAFTTALTEGRTAFEGFDLAKAQQGFTRAVAFAPTAETKAVAILWLGVIATENGDFAAANGRFAEAVALDPGVVVPEHLSPTIQQLVDEARAHALERRQSVAPTLASPVDQPLQEKPRWALLSGGAVTVLGVLAVGGGAMVGMQAITQRDVAQSLEFQNDAVAEYQKAREGALWSNVLYGAGGVLVATGSGLAVASFLGADGP